LIGQKFINFVDTNLTELCQARIQGKTMVLAAIEIWIRQYSSANWYYKIRTSAQKRRMWQYLPLSIQGLHKYCL